MLFDPLDLGLDVLSESGYHLGGKQVPLCQEAFQLCNDHTQDDTYRGCVEGCVPSSPYLDLTSQPGATRT